MNETVYGAVIMTIAFARVHPVSLTNADLASGGRQPSDQANWLGLQVCLSAVVVHIRHHHLLLSHSPKLMPISPSHKG